MELEREAAPGIHRIEDAFTNWYLVEADDGLTIVDAGVRGAWPSLAEAVGAIGRRLDEVRAILLTHAHFDHIGFAERARSELGVPVWVHEDDAPLTKRPRQYAHEAPRSLYFATQGRALPIVAALVRRRAWWPQPIAAVERLESAMPEVPGSPRLLPTPGHTLGHVAFDFRDRDAAIAGDALVMLDPYTARPGPRIVAGAATADSERALRSLDVLAETGRRTVLTGHGGPWRGGAEAAVTEARRIGRS